jgi:hypothetical protein
LMKFASILSDLGIAKKHVPLKSFFILNGNWNKVEERFILRYKQWLIDFDMCASIIT